MKFLRSTIWHWFRNLKNERPAEHFNEKKYIYIIQIQKASSTFNWFSIFLCLYFAELIALTNSPHRSAEPETCSLTRAILLSCFTTLLESVCASWRVERSSSGNSDGAALPSKIAKTRPPRTSVAVVPCETISKYVLLLFQSETTVHTCDRGARYCTSGSLEILQTARSGRARFIRTGSRRVPEGEVIILINTRARARARCRQKQKFREALVEEFRLLRYARNSGETGGGKTAAYFDQTTRLVLRPSRATLERDVFESNRA